MMGDRKRGAFGVLKYINIVRRGGRKHSTLSGLLQFCCELASNEAPPPSEIFNITSLKSKIGKKRDKSYQLVGH